jgi:hypothetical protein
MTDFEFKRVISEGEEVIGCAVCGRVLNAWVPVLADGTVLDSQTDYRHGLAELPEDHLPVPVPYGDLGQNQRGKCDFCAAEDPGWVVPVRTFTVDYGPGVDRPDDLSVANWAACDTCVRYIRKDRWDWLAEHVGQQIGAQFSLATRDEVLARIARLHQQVRQNMRGKPFREKGPLK